MSDERRQGPFAQARTVQEALCRLWRRGPAVPHLAKADTSGCVVPLQALGTSIDIRGTATASTGPPLPAVQTGHAAAKRAFTMVGDAKPSRRASAGCARAAQRPPARQERSRPGWRRRGSTGRSAAQPPHRRQGPRAVARRLSRPRRHRRLLPSMVGVRPQRILRVDQSRCTERQSRCGKASCEHERNGDDAPK